LPLAFCFLILSTPVLLVVSSSVVVVVIGGVPTTWVDGAVALNSNYLSVSVRTTLVE
jgi:hypothetical protein